MCVSMDRYEVSKGEADVSRGRYEIQLLHTNLDSPVGVFASLKGGIARWLLELQIMFTAPSYNLYVSVCTHMCMYYVYI